MRRSLWAVWFVLVAGCGTTVGPRVETVALNVVPEFGALASFAANVDRLVIIIERDSSGIFAEVVRDSVPIDPVTGEASVDLTVVVLRNPETFRVTLQAIRTSDGAVLFSGQQSIQVSAGSGGSPGAGQTVSIPVTYGGPTSAQVVVSPADTSVAEGSTYQLQATALDAAGRLVDVPITFDLQDPADSTLLTVGRLNGVVSVGTGTSNVEVFLVARSADGRADTARVFIGQTPGGVAITPGFANVSVGNTLQLAASIVDQAGNPLTSSGITWLSRSPTVGAVDATGLVTAAGVGTTVVVATGAGFSDSALINIPAAGTVVGSAMLLDASGVEEAFGVVRTGDTVVIGVTIDMRETAGERLGSFNATADWDPTLLQYVRFDPGNPANPPVVNAANAGTGQVRFAGADPTGSVGQVLVGRIVLVAVAQGSLQPTLTFTELSAAQTFTNLLGQVAVIQGRITVRP